MRDLKRRLALTAALGLILAGCADGGDDQAAQDENANEEAGDAETDGDTETDGDGPDGAQALPGGEDPNEDVEDGVYRGSGVTLPVPEGWSLDPMAFQQGIVAAMPEDGSQQLTARAIDREQAEATGADVEGLDIDTLLDSVRQQIDQDADADEQVDLGGASRAHRLTYVGIESPQQGQPESSATIVFAEAGDGLIGEFVYSAAVENYDEELATLLVEEAGFDPDSAPPELPQPPQPQPAPENGGDGEPGGETDDAGETGAGETDADESDDTDEADDGDEGEDGSS